MFKLLSYVIKMVISITLIDIQKLHSQNTFNKELECIERDKK